MRTRTLGITRFGLAAAVGAAAALALVLVPARDGAGVVAVAAADKANPDVVDVSAYRDKMVVVHDGNGHYIIAVPAASHYTTVFYGDGKVFYLQRAFGGGMDGSNQSMNASLWDPRTDNRASLEQKKGAWTMECGKRTTALKPLGAAETKKMLSAAEFRPPRWKYQAYKLARDDRGTYYYVDRLRDEYGGKGFRMWVGPRGQMVRQRMTNIVSDSEGDIFATKDGSLRFIVDPKQSLWISGKRRRELTNVPVLKNVQMIYAELGVYLGDLGTPCDHL